MQIVSSTFPRLLMYGYVLNETLTWVSFAVLYNVAVPKGVDDCIRVLAHREQGMQSISVSDINR